jgi:predicted phage replisome organizer
MGRCIVAERKYYWLKLKNDFFNQPRIKKLRRLAGGDTYTIIYLKMQLLSLENEGVLFFEGIEDDFIEELALTIDEDTENVRFTVMYLVNQGLLEEVRKDEYLLPETVKAIGSEAASTRRSRECRKRQQALQSNGIALQGNTDATEMQREATICNTEIELEKEIDIDKDIEKESSSKKKPTTRFKPPTLDEARAYVQEAGLHRVDLDRFFSHYEANGWKVGRNPMKDWKAALRYWNSNEMDKPQWKVGGASGVKQKFTPEGRDLAFLEK